MQEMTPMNSCPSCGAENRPTARFCHQCGYSLMTVGAPSPPSAASEVVVARHDEENGSVDAVEVGDPVSPAAPAFLDEPDPPAPKTIAPETAESDAPFDAVISMDGEIASSPAVDALAADATTVDIENPGGDLPAVAEMRLEVGALVAGRFAVQSVAVQDDGCVRYGVEDRGVCPACHALIQPSEEEPYCFECGAYVMAPDLARPQRVLAPVIDGSVDTGEIITADGQAFFLLPEVAASPTDADPSAQADSFPRGVQLLVGQRSDVGLARADQPDEDSVFALTLSAIYASRAAPTLGLYLVADGMGGHGDGEIASRLVAETVGGALLQTLILPLLQGKPLPAETVEALLDNAMQLGNRLVRQEATARGNDMGSTLTLAFVHDNHAFVANVGDSRTYLWRGGVLQQITEDHSAVFQLFRVGAITEEEIYTHPRRNEITRNMGFRLTVQPDFYQLDLLPGDTLLLCCDGLWEMLHNDGIADLFLTSYGDPQQICDELIRRANQAGGDDNISVLAVRVQA
jgi:serine/threonine protein phosphatase PrpC